MKLKKLTMHVVKMPLKKAFYTHLETVTEREAIIIQVEDEHGAIGWGEASAFSTPWYTEETVKTEWHLLKDVLFPLLKDRKLDHPEEISRLFSIIRGNRMAKAGVESAVWDLYAKQVNKPLYKVLGGTCTSIPAGAVAAGKTSDEMLERIAGLIEKGYERIKVKISPEQDVHLLSAIRNAYPDVPLMADANSAYSMKDHGQLKQLDQFQLMMIEQPFSTEDIWDHAKLQKELRTPICLDESIRSLHDAASAVEMGACRVVNLKFSRVGGMMEAKRIHDYCLKKKVDIWAGGMIEFGISRAHNIALASLPGFTLPGDIVSTDHYWEEDVIEPGIFVENGRIKLSEKPGIGYEVNEKWLRKKREGIYFV